jgi:pyruvate oxidase
VRVAAAAELSSGRMIVVEIEGRDVVVVNDDDRYYALDNRCPHLGGPLGKGRLEEGAIVCPWHGWRWDPKSGRAVWPQVDWRAFSYPVVVEDGQILVRVA